MQIKELLPFHTSEKTASPASPQAFSEISAEERQRRARVIQSMAVLDTPPEECFDALARLAAHVCAAPIALVSLIDEDRVWFKANHGVAIEYGSNNQSFCCEAANSKRVLEVVNPTVDPGSARTGWSRAPPVSFTMQAHPSFTRGWGLGRCV